MKMTIITIVFNDKNHIEQTIRSIIDQQIPHIEYIIIDGGSTDGTVEIIEKYLAHIDLFVSEKDEGIVDAFNKGIRKATGDMIGLVNSGDFLEKGALKKVSDLSQQSNAGVIYGNMQYWLDGKKEYVYKADHHMLPQFMSLNHPAVFVKKEIYDTYGLFDEAYTLAMDYDLMLRLYTQHVKFIYINEILSNMSLGGVSDINWRLAYSQSFAIRKKYLKGTVSLYCSYYWQIGKRYVSNAVDILGLGSIKKVYRLHISPIKKEKI